jgi:hypothetical protein
MGGRTVNVWNANFQELYQRHLCRHSQFGINVIHLAAVIGTYLALYGLGFAVAQGIGYMLSSLSLEAGVLASKWVLLAITVPYLAILAANLPARVLIATLACVGLFFAVFFALPPLPVWALWAYPATVFACYKIQSWSHKIYDREMNMTEFNKKYPKGFKLFVLLSIYELPILLNYLLFGKQDWYTETSRRDWKGGGVPRVAGEDPLFTKGFIDHANAGDSASVR